jgi:hypothetical protein
MGINTMKGAAQGFGLNLDKLLAEPNDQAKLKARLDRLPMPARQMANVLAYCTLAHSTLGDGTLADGALAERNASAGHLEGITGNALRTLMGEAPREKTPFTESLRAMGERVAYFVNHRVLRKSEAALSGSCPTVALLKARAPRNQAIMQGNDERRSETARVLSQYLVRLGSEAAVKELSALLSSEDLAAQIAVFSARLAQTSDAVEGLPQEPIVSKAPLAADEPAVEEGALEKGAVEELPSVESDARSMVSPTEDEQVSGAQSDQEFSPVLAEAQPVEAKPVKASAENSVTSTEKTKDLAVLANPITQTQTAQSRDWITLAGRVMSAMTILALLYSYYSQSSNGSENIS